MANPPKWDLSWVESQCMNTGSIWHEFDRWQLSCQFRKGKGKDAVCWLLERCLRAAMDTTDELKGEDV